MSYYLTWFLGTVLYSPIFYQLYRSRWEHINYTHAYFVLPVSLWLVWRKRHTLRELLLDKSGRLPKDTSSLTAVITGLLMFIFGWRQDYLFITALSLIPVLWGITRYLYGRKMVRAVSFPIFYLLFLVPPPLGILDRITIPMRYGVSQATEIILRMLHYPITRNGLMLTMGGNEIFMGAPCSGFRSLITMFALAIAYVYVVKGPRRNKLILVASVLPFALLGNLIRVITLCLITFYAGREAAEGFFHYFSGGLIFLVMICCLIGLEHLLNRSQKTGAEPK
ncbi:MAG: exosortase/archaeosortase family protein [Candidatus Omnitrophica bacterium]|nr:exosortase/archaeosortase family protein [Candidatus Omnitrophota bacterium]